MLVYSTAALVFGVILDCIFGDPRRFPHIIIGIGKLISKLEKSLREHFKLSIGGVLLVILTILITSLFCLILMLISYKINSLLGIIIESIIIWQMLAAKSLKKESMKVYDRLSQNDIDGARLSVSMIVGRDTKNLDDKGIAKAAVETVAENTSDGVIAPLFYISIFGALGGIIYKSINTLDSMVGYKNKKYKVFGKASAKTDDFVNFIPSRLSALLMILSSWVLGYDSKNAALIFKRDRFNHASPNSAQTESVCAGALNIQLAGDTYYFGKLYKKPYIGDNNREIEASDIIRANKLMYVSAVILSIIVLIIRLTIIFATGAIYEIL